MNTQRDKRNVLYDSVSKWRHILWTLVVIAVSMGIFRETPRTYSKNTGTIPTICPRRTGSWTHAPSTLQSYRNESNNLSPLRGSLDGRAPRKYSKITRQVNVGAFVERFSHAGRQTIGQHLAKFDPIWPKVDQMWPTLANLAPIRRLARDNFSTSAPGCIFRVILECMRGACSRTGAGESICWSIVRVIVEHARGVSPGRAQWTVSVHKVIDGRSFAILAQHCSFMFQVGLR